LKVAFALLIGSEINVRKSQGNHIPAQIKIASFDTSLLAVCPSPPFIVLRDFLVEDSTPTAHQTKPL
jgi:hypothetical protein